MKSIKTIYRVTSYAAALLLLLSVTYATDLKSPVFELKSQSLSPVIDGDLKDAGNIVAERFHLLGNANQTSEDTILYITADSKWLFLAADCKYPKPQDMKITTRQNSNSVCNDESIEIFIDPGTDGKMYFQLMLNPANARFEKAILKDGSKNTACEIPWRSATKITEKGWTAEIAIPLYYLMAYGDMSKIKLNVCRNMHMQQYDPYGVNVGSKLFNSSWAPLISGYHEPQNFGILKGLDKIKISIPFVTSIKKAQISKFYSNEKGIFYDINLQVQAYTSQKGSVQLSINDKPVNDDPSEIVKVLDFSRTGVKDIKIAIPVKSLAQREIKITMKEPVKNEIIQSVKIDDTSILDIISAYPALSYFTTEKKANIVTELGLPEKDLAESTIVARNEQGDIIAEIMNLKPKTILSLDISKLNIGRNKINIELTDKRGKFLSGIKIDLLKKEPRPGFEWKVDNSSNGIFRDGKPFFPCGMWINDNVRTKDAYAKAYSEIKETGADTVIQYTRAAKLITLKDIMDAAEKNNINAIVRIDGFSEGVELKTLDEFFKDQKLEMLKKRYNQNSYYADLCTLKGDLGRDFFKDVPRAGKSKIYAEFFDKNLSNMTAAINDSRKYESLAGYYTFDEPQFRDFEQFVQGRILTEKIKETDGYKPVYIVYSSYIPEGKEATDWCDMLGTDPYWIPAGKGVRGNINFVAKITWETKRRCVRDRKGCYTIPCGEYWSGCHKRAMLPEEQYCQTYLTLIYGAKGIFYYVYPVNHKYSMDAMSKMFREIQVLAPSLLSADIPQKINYNPGKFDPENNIFPDVHVNLRENPEGGLLFLVANSKKYPVNVTYKISCADVKSEAENIFSKAKLALNDRSFSETLPPYATRAYKIKGTRPAHEDAAIDVTMKPDALNEIKEALEIPRAGRPDKRNIAPNPGIEEATLNGWPDYYRPLIGVYPRITEKNSCWGIDSSCSFEGQNSLMFKGRGQGFDFYMAPLNQTEKAYTFSVFLKADNDNTRVRVSMKGYAGKFEERTLTKEWQRYTFSDTYSAGISEYNSIMVQLITDGTVWADAVQVESGTSASEYQN